MKPLLLSLLAALSSGCATASRTLEVRLKDVADVEPARDKKLETCKPKTVCLHVSEAPDKLALDGGRFRFHDGELTTPATNIERADVSTTWTQPMGILPSLGEVVLGGAFALGFGVAGGATLADALQAHPVDGASVGEGAGFLAGALAGAALATYGVVTWGLVQGAPTTESVTVPRE